MATVETVLSLCDFSGAWSAPYEAAGYRVVRVDLARGGDVRLLRKLDGPVRGILAAPPCQHFARSGAPHWANKGAAELIEGLSVVDACLRAVVVHRPEWWALENPIGRLVDYLGPPGVAVRPVRLRRPLDEADLALGPLHAPGPALLPLGPARRPDARGRDNPFPPLRPRQERDPGRFRQGLLRGQPLTGGLPLATAESWFVEFYLHTLDVIPRQDWPEKDAQFWLVLKREFVARGVQRQVATEAVDALALRGMAHVDSFPAAVMAQVRRLWSPDAAPVLRHDTRDASWNYAADVHWHSLPEDDREAARSYVRRAWPVFARHPAWLEALAKGWAFEPWERPAPAPHPAYRDLPPGVSRFAWSPTVEKKENV